MGKVIIPAGSGAGSGSDECSSTRAEVLKGYTAITSDSDDESLEGTLELTGDASDSQVLVGKTYYNTNPKSKRAGSMVNQGAVSQTLNASGSYTIPAGYHNGSGKVTANSLASQTSGTSTAGQILSGYTAWVNGSKLTGTMAVQSILSFSAAVYSSTAITFTWQNPAKGPFSGVIIVGKTGSYPTSISDGTRFYKGGGSNSSASGTSSTTVSSFTGGTTYYFRAFSYAIKDSAEWVHATSYTVTATTTKGMQTFTSSGTFTVPDNVRSIDLFSVGGGGGGGGGNAGVTYSYQRRGGFGGCGGYTTTLKSVAVTPGQSISIIVGAGGFEGTYGVNGSSGGATYFVINGTNYCVANGGGGGMRGSITTLTPNSGGSGGGVGGSGLGSQDGASGGSDGGNGGTNSTNTTASTGQESTTRAFGESSNTLYAGGGGGAGVALTSGTNYSYAGAGGSGGGGNGAEGNYTTYIAGTAGTANTGGGGGGGCYGGGNGTGFAGGTGIALIRWGY